MKISRGLEKVGAGVRRLFRVRSHFQTQLRRLWTTSTGLRFLSRLRNRRFLLSAYYFLSKTFWHEQRVLFSGRIKYHQHTADPQGQPVALLRRNIHRIEKGICARERRRSFAEGYIGETVAALRSLVAHGGSESFRTGQASPSATIQWAIDALVHYFDIVEQTPAIQAARSVFQQTLSESELRATDRHSYRCAERPRSTITYEDMNDLASQRRSIRWYEPRPVPHDLLEKAIDLARQSPSACNRQPFRFFIFDDPHTVQALARLAGGATDFVHNIPCLVVLVGQQRAYFNDRDLHLIYIDTSLAAMTFMYALETLGLSSCCINWPNSIEADTAAVDLLGLAADERIIMLMSVGFPDPDALVAASAKRSMDELRSYGSA